MNKNENNKTAKMVIKMNVVFFYRTQIKSTKMTRNKNERERLRMPGNKIEKMCLQRKDDELRKSGVGEMAIICSS